VPIVALVNRILYGLTAFFYISQKQRDFWEKIVEYVGHLRSLVD
jgi:hypothetical protein